MLIVTSDHGQIETPPARAEHLSGHPALQEMLLMPPAAEPRASWLYVRPGHAESVRAYVVGRRVVGAAEIHSPEIDYRQDEHDVIPTRLRGDEQRAAIAAAKACGMAFSGVDLIRYPGGVKVLECNPSPMFYVFEQKTGLDIAGPLARLLIAKHH